MDWKTKMIGSGSLFRKKNCSGFGCRDFKTRLIVPMLTMERETFTRGARAV